jgi:hypothetical protein
MSKVFTMRGILALVLVSMFSFTGCATIFKGTNAKVGFESAPPQAEVWVNGNLMGKTPLKLKLNVKEDYRIEFRKEGFQSEVVLIQNKVGAGWIVLDVLAGLVPVIIDAVTGAWYDLDQKNVNVVLKAQQ